MKKLLLTLGTIVSIAAPIACVVSCSYSLEKVKNQIDTRQSAEEQGYVYSTHRPHRVDSQYDRDITRYVTYYKSKEDYLNKSKDYVNVIIGSSSNKNTGSNGMATGMAVGMAVGGK